MNEILQLGQRCAEAEQRGDIAALDAMTVGNFTLVGPLGFVLDKVQWLDRYGTASLSRHRSSGTTSTCGSMATLPSRSAGTPAGDLPRPALRRAVSRYPSGGQGRRAVAACQHAAEPHRPIPPAVR
jgi:hypothetical protein